MVSICSTRTRKGNLRKTDYDSLVIDSFFSFFSSPKKRKMMIMKVSLLLSVSFIDLWQNRFNTQIIRKSGRELHCNLYQHDMIWSYSCIHKTPEPWHSWLRSLPVNANVYINESPFPLMADLQRIKKRYHVFWYKTIFEKSEIAHKIC